MCLYSSNTSTPSDPRRVVARAGVCSTGLLRIPCAGPTTYQIPVMAIPVDASSSSANDRTFTSQAIHHKPTNKYTQHKPNTALTLPSSLSEQTVSLQASIKEGQPQRRCPPPRRCRPCEEHLAPSFAREGSGTAGPPGPAKLHTSALVSEWPVVAKTNLQRLAGPDSNAVSKISYTLRT